MDEKVFTFIIIPQMRKYKYPNFYLRNVMRHGAWRRGDDMGARPVNLVGRFSVFLHPWLLIWSLDCCNPT